MKPLKLTVEGLKSVAESQTINFEKLAENGLFGIFGKTGSGKSTVLDAIVLALYGEVVQSVNNRDFVNLGCMQTRVELIFSVSAGDKKGKYGIERVFKFNKARTDVTQLVARLWLIEDDGSEYSEADNARELNDKIQNEILGLKKDEFLKCIALPQGEFSAFIKLTASERVKVVGKLFDLERYGAELQHKISKRGAALNAEQIEKRTMLESLKEYEPSLVEETGKLLKQAEGELAVLLKTKNEKSKMAEGAKRYIALSDEQGKLNAELQKITAYKSIIDDNRAFIALYDELGGVAADIKEAAKTRKQIADLEQEISDCKQRLLDLKKSKLEIERKVSAIPETEAKIASLNGKLERLKAVAEKEDELKEKKERLIELRKAYLNAQKDYNENEKAAKSHETKKAEYLAQAAAVDEKTWLLKVSKSAAEKGLADFSSERLNFLNELKNYLSGKVAGEHESAVNRLIEQEIERIRQSIPSGESTEMLADVLEQALNAVKKKANSNSLASAEGESALSCRKECEKAQKDMERFAEDGKTVSEECKKTENAIKEVTGGKTVAEVEKDVEKEIADLTAGVEKLRRSQQAILQEFASIKSKFDGDTARLERLKETLKIAEDNCKVMLEKLGLAEGRALSILSKADEVRRKRDEIAEFDKKSAYAFNRSSEIEKQLAELSDFSGGAALVSASEQAASKYDEFNIYYNKIKDCYEIGLKKSEQWCIINKELIENERATAINDKLAELVKAGKFMEFIADEYLREVADDAERRVLTLTGGKYGLVYDREFFVTDNLSGGVRRPVAGLSGGETFLVSLSLALALASEISRKALKPVDFFFLDEGFGTLDDELIDTVTDSLEKLRRENLTVGLITHVAELKNRIESSISVVGANAEHGTRFYTE